MRLTHSLLTQRTVVGFWHFMSALLCQRHIAAVNALCQVSGDACCGNENTSLSPGYDEYHVCVTNTRQSATITLLFEQYVPEEQQSGIIRRNIGHA